MNEILQGECREVMKTLEPNSVDCIVTDPPYGLSFMGKEWDHGVPGKEFWALALQASKPGAHLLAFGGTRTFHRLTCAIEDAGWEIRDCMMWLYGSGFPKSHDVSKAIDKAAGAERKNGNLIGKSGEKRNAMEGGDFRGEYFESEAVSPSARQWSGWGTALKPAWEPIIVARKPLDGTVAQNVQKWGTGGMDIDGSRIGTDDTRSKTGSRPDFENYRMRPDVVAGSASGRWPANVILDEEAGAMLDGQSGDRPSGTGNKNVSNRDERNAFGKGLGAGNGIGIGGDSGGASRFFYCAKASKRERNAGLEGMPEVQKPLMGEFKNNPGRTTPKSSPIARANFHPTVKPIALLSYLIRLVCPENAIVLDPFIGSGSTALAAMKTGRRFIGIEKEEKYIAIAKARIDGARDLAVAV